MQSDHVSSSALLGRPESEIPPKVQTLVIGPHNIAQALAHPPRAFEFLRIDVSTNCNLFCTYCEIGRGKSMLDLSQMRDFFAGQVASVENIFFGCAMEPTINKDLAQYMLAARELADPPGQFGIQSNGTLLHRHDFKRFRAAGLNTFSLSIDSVRPETMVRLRDGTDVRKVISNLEALRDEIPSLFVMFSVVVSRDNYQELTELVEFAIEFGVRQVWLREVTFQYRDVTPERKALVLDPGQFDELNSQLEKYASRIPLFFINSELLAKTDRINRRAVTEI